MNSKFHNQISRVTALVLAVLAAFAAFQLTTFAQTMTASSDVTPAATSSAVQTTTSTSSAMITGTSSPATTTPVSFGTEVNGIPWIEAVLPWRPWSVLRQGADYIVGANDLYHGTSLLLRINAASGTVSRIATLDTDLYGLAVEGKYFLVTDGDGNLLKISSKGTVTTIAASVTSPGFASSVAVASSSYAVTDYLNGHLVRVASDGTVSVIASGLRHITAVIFDDPDYIVGATANDTSEPYLYRVTAVGTTTPIANLRPVLNFSQVTGITKLGSVPSQDWWESEVALSPA
jgi:hypothetical protein